MLHSMNEQKNAKKEKRIKPELPGGFRDYGLAKAAAKQKIMDTARGVFEKYGFEPLFTSAAQKTEVLTGGEEESKKIIFGICGSEEEKSENSLRFDLTVPLARFVSANLDAPRPYKRYEIGRAWRGERQQTGRYREFTQADADIVGTSSPDADAEVLAIVNKILTSLKIENFSLRVNFRNESKRIMEEFDIKKENQAPTFVEVDKKDKLPYEKWEENVKKASGLNTENAKKYIERISGKKSIPAEFENIKSRALKLGVAADKLDYNASLVRGFAYYTGIVFETILQGAEKIGSIAGGGRYDNLVEKFTGQKIPAVGCSLGVDRLLAALESAGQKIPTESSAKVLFMNLLEDAGEINLWAQELRAQNINTDVYMGESRDLKAQLAYALKKEIPLVVIYGEDEKKKRTVVVKNLRTQEQKKIAKDELIEYIVKEIK